MYPHKLEFVIESFVEDGANGFPAETVTHNLERRIAMKRSWTGFLLASAVSLTCLLPAGVASAETTPTSTISTEKSVAAKASISPLSPLYGAKRLFEHLELFLTFSGKGKAQLLADFAQLRASEATGMMLQHHAKKVPGLLGQYRLELKTAQSLMAKAGSNKKTDDALRQAAFDGQVAATLADKGGVEAKDTARTADTASAVATVADPVASGPELGHGETLILNLLAKASGKSPSTIADLRASGMGWGKIAHHLGLTLGSIIAAAQSSLDVAAATPSSTSPSVLMTTISTTTTPPPSSSTSPTVSPTTTTSATSGAMGAVVGTLNAATSTSVTVNGTSYPLAPSVIVHDGDHVVLPTNLPVGSTVLLRVNAAGQVTGLWVKESEGTKKSKSSSQDNQDHKKPEHTKDKQKKDHDRSQSGTVVGTISAVSSGQITMDGTQYSVLATATVRYHDFQLAASDLVPHMRVALRDNGQDQVSRVEVLTDPNLPPSKVLVGQVTALSSTSLSLDGYTLTTHNINLTTKALLSVGQRVLVRLDSNGAIKEIRLIGAQPGKDHTK